MESNLLEVHTGILHTFDGKPHQVEGGVYLTPEAYLHTTAELERLRQKREAEDSSTVPALVMGAALVGLLAGFWLGRRGRSED